MRTLKPPYLFGTSGNYAAGALDWSGQPRIVVPSTAQLADGFTPDTPIPAEQLNYLENLKADALAVQAHAPLRTWSRFTVDPASGLIANSVVGMLPARGFDTNAERQRMPVLLGLNAGGRLTVALSADGSAFETPRVLTALGATSAPTSAARGAAGEVLVANNAFAGLFVNTNHTVTGSWATQTWGSNNKLAVHYAPGSPSPYLVLDNLGRFSNATSIAGLTGSTALPSVTSLAAAVAEFADDGGQNVVLVCQPGASAVSLVYYSNDGGASYTLALGLTGTAGNVTYSKALGSFVTWDSSGQMYASPTGAPSSWALIAVNATTANGFISGPKTLAACGPAIAKLTLNPLASGAFFQRGIAYTFGLSNTWNFSYFGDVAGNSLAQLREINNRFCVADPVSLWQSGVIASPATEL